MSMQPGKKSDRIERSDNVELLIRSQQKDLGEFVVRRSLPAPGRRMVGPYIFFDHMGPVDFTLGNGVSVRPHPHIGIATVTFLFDGEIVHRDSLGIVQPIRPGAVNLMTAGKGIVHSERTSEELMREGASLHGIQLWLALPEDLQESEPAFAHYPADEIPQVAHANGMIRIIMGEAFGVKSPVRTASPTLYTEIVFTEPGDLDLPEGYTERAVYVVNGEILIGSHALGTGDMAIIVPGATTAIKATADTRAMIIGGEPFPERRHIWWNFVSTSTDRIELAKRDWAQGKFEEVPGETEFIPLPE